MTNEKQVLPIDREQLTTEQVSDVLDTWEKINTTSSDSEFDPTMPFQEKPLSGN